MNEITIKIKGLIKDEVCMGTYGLVELELNSAIPKALAEQHRNTRHDAVDKIQEIRAKWAEKYNFSPSDTMMDEITGAIINLKQR